MHTLTIHKSPCEECCDAVACRLVQCPECGGVRWLDDWEVYDDFAVCPSRGCIVSGYQSLDERKYVCRREIESLAEAEAIAELRGIRRRGTKPKKNTEAKLF